MDRKVPERNTEIQEKLKRIAEKGTGLPALLAARGYGFYGVDTFRKLWGALTAEYGKAPIFLTSVDQFWCPALARAVTYLVGSSYAEELHEILKLRVEGQYSSSMWRHSYHSKDFGYYASSAVDLLCSLITASSYTESVEELLYCNNDGIYGYPYKYRLALRIRKNDSKIISLLREAIMGDSSQVLLTRQVIEAIIISRNEELLDALLKLLLAAKMQEGVRQQILESADVGSIEVLTRILKLCIDEDLFRFSSAIRAFDTWTGLGYGDAKPAYVKKCAEYAYACLTDETVRREYFNSENTQQAYFALWATGCYEIADAESMTQRLLEDNNKYRRALGWLFVSRSESERYKMYFAQKFLGERDEELLAWVVSCLPLTHELLISYHSSGNDWNNKAVKNELFSSQRKERHQLFAELKALALYIGNKSRIFTGNPFDFITITLENTRVISCMMSVAGYDMDTELIDQLLELKDLMNADQRQALIIHFVKPETLPVHRAYLRNAMNDRSVYARKLAAERLSACKLDREDYAVLAENLRSKSSSLRKAVLSVLHRRSFSELKPVIALMLESEEEYQNQAAIELLLDWKDVAPQITEEYAQALGRLGQKKLSTQTQIIFDRLIGQTDAEEEYTSGNGFGLYDPALTHSLAESIAPISASSQKTGILSSLFGRKDAAKNGLLTAVQLRELLPEWKELDALLSRMNQVFERHADYEYEADTWDGRTKVLFGDPRRDILLPSEHGVRSLSNIDAHIEMVPFYEEFLAAMGDYAADAEKMIGLRCVITDSHISRIDDRTEIEPWFAPYEKLLRTDTYNKAGFEKYGERYWQLVSFLSKTLHQLDSHEVFEVALRWYRSAVAVLGEQNLCRTYTRQKANVRYISYGYRMEHRVVDYRILLCMRSVIRDLKLSSEDFKVWFLQEYRLEKLADTAVHCGLTVEDYFRACGDGIAPIDILMEFLIQTPGNVISTLTNPNRWRDGRELYEKYPWAADVVKKFVDRVVQIEEKRGELPTPLTGHAQSVERLEGAVHFCNLLAALGKESFFRGYLYSTDQTKKATLSLLLKRCYPSADDTSERLASLLQKTDISDKRLVEAVMYAPQWAGLAETIIGWQGLKCGVWFFHAHINETFSAEKETEVAIYSPISPVQFNDGAFDKNWFWQAYEQLGEKRFQILYKSAKYITSGSNQHRRSQLYTDAVLGRLDAKEIVREITEKRNQEKLRCYPLIPIREGDRKEALRRYEFIQKFLKESKQFGAQRRESEKKACATAMENLAITTGLMDVNRLVWQMESAKMEEIRPYMNAVTLEGVSVRLLVDENGDAEILIEKNGKAVKSAPKSLAKDEYFLTIKALVKDLKEQKRRAKESLERAMIESTLFGAEELVNICGNPVLAPMVGSLVWTDGTNNGFPSMDGGRLTLTTLSGNETIPSAAQLRIAHPHDLRESGEWAGYMRLLYEGKRVQPFKQVFREYYPVTEDEKQEGLVSRRYAGHQVQPKKTAMLLKSRGWTVDYEEGLQKVYYKENLIVRMYALADWFSPSDIEAPTIETVRFFDRNSGEPVELSTVPPIVFSETMRDIDLAVSVAHVGGVDPEASHSTVEMRVAIATELARLLKLQNISWLGSHAKIQGKLASYSVHMGSGVVHAEGRGMIAILPVHSQARGRIFLPFADDDPKTAEIMSKIILLTEDQKIKDPAILDQICS